MSHPLPKVNAMRHDPYHTLIETLRPACARPKTAAVAIVADLRGQLPGRCSTPDLPGRVRGVRAVVGLSFDPF